MCGTLMPINVISIGRTEVQKPLCLKVVGVTGLEQTLLCLLKADRSMKFSFL